MFNNYNTTTQFLITLTYFFFIILFILGCPINEEFCIGTIVTTFLFLIKMYLGKELVNFEVPFTKILKNNLNNLKTVIKFSINTTLIQINFSKNILKFISVKVQNKFVKSYIKLLLLRTQLPNNLTFFSKLNL
jgi:hypothetical protein